MADTIKITTLEQLKVALQAAKTYIDGQIGGLGSLAGKSEVAYDDLAAALKALSLLLWSVRIPASLFVLSLLKRSLRSSLVLTQTTTL